MAESGGVAKGPAPSGTVTFLFSDIEGSTKRWARDRAAMQAAVRLHDGIMRAAIAEHGGHVFKTMGDAFCAAFATPTSAAAAALAAQRGFAAADFSAVDGLRVRMALNTGTADERDGDYFGPTLNRVARLLPLGHGGQILLTSVTAGLVRENLPPQATLVDLGEHELKDLPGHERVYQIVAPDTQRAFPALRSQKALQPWLVPAAMRTRYFTGRDELLARIRRQLTEKYRAALSGLGGAGKTQTAIEYAVRNRAEYPGGVFWVNADTIGGLTSGYVEIAKALRLPQAESNDQEATVRAVIAWLNGNDGWLLILDNVDDRVVTRRFVPDGGKGHVLLTSRESVFAELGIPRALDVGDLDAEEAVLFLLARTGRHDAGPDDRAAAELAAELGHLPLALEQAAAYIAENNTAFSAYLAAFRKRRLTLLEKSGALVAHDTVATTWAANFEAVERDSPAAADVLRVSALFAPDAIPFDVFLAGASALGEPIAHALGDPDDLAMAELLRPLTRYSLVRSDAGLRIFSVHRLVQEIVWAALAEAERRRNVERVAHALARAFPEVELATWAQCERLVPHVASLVARLRPDDVQPDDAARVSFRAGNYLIQRGRYPEAQASHERALAILERALGADHPDVARSLSAVAVARWYQGHYAAAQPLHERALAILERTLGPDHLEVASGLNRLANIHSVEGRYAEARPLYERALAIRERALGTDHPSLGNILINLANDCDQQGRYSEAQALYERALALWEPTLGPNHPMVAGTLDNLARTYAKQGRHAAAESIVERAAAIREQTLPPDHPDVSISINSVAKSFLRRSQYDEAETLFERALSIRERAFGPEHQFVAESLGGLALAYVRTGRFAEAESLFERAVTIQERALGPEHVYLAETLAGLAALREEQGRSADAVALLERVLAIKGRAFAADHPELAEIRDAIGRLRAAG